MAKKSAANWVHSVCDDCYKFLHPGKQPKVVDNPDKEECCICGSDTDAGIFYWSDPKFMDCNGIHGKQQNKDDDF